MATLTAYRGLPASGKTKHALGLLDAAQTGRMVRVNRDALRSMLLPADYWTRELTDQQQQVAEDTVTVAQHAMIRALLRRGTDVLVDDTNLHPERLDLLVEIAEDTGAPWVLHDLTGVDVETCIARDAGRPDGQCVREQRIRAMHDAYQQLTATSTEGDRP